MRFVDIHTDSPYVILSTYGLTLGKILYNTDNCDMPR
jgi:hypothetical protein